MAWAAATSAWICREGQVERRRPGPIQSRLRRGREVLEPLLVGGRRLRPGTGPTGIRSSSRRAGPRARGGDGEEVVGRARRLDGVGGSCPLRGVERKARRALPHPQRASTRPTRWSRSRRKPQDGPRRGRAGSATPGSCRGHVAGRIDCGGIQGAEGCERERVAPVSRHRVPGPWSGMSRRTDQRGSARVAVWRIGPARLGSYAGPGGTPLSPCSSTCTLRSSALRTCSRTTAACSPCHADPDRRGPKPDRSESRS